MLKIKKIGLILGPTTFIIVLNFFHPDGIEKEANAILASTLWIAIWWITEAIPIAVTSINLAVVHLYNYRYCC